MGGLMSLSKALPLVTVDAGAELRSPQTAASRRVMASVAWHGLLWLVVANCVGVLLAAMLLLPEINSLLGQWTYRRWIPVHMNLQLYGWCSLPLVGFLFHVYGVHRGEASKWATPVVWLWSIALGVGAVSWLNGHSTGKLFLDWTGYARVLFPIEPFYLWTLLTLSFCAEWR
jgi:cytochrome c oxidase cbb3-type subunit 1